MVYESFDALIGHTPLLRLHGVESEENLSAKVYAKLEMFNPAGSAKDRIARQMIEAAEAAGQLVPGGVIVEPTSGNTGIGLSAVAARRGYRVILTMPDSMSKERIALLKAYGAEIVLTEGAKGMAGAVAKAHEIAAALPHAFEPDQFGNPANPCAHFQTTGPEIWQDLDGQVDALIAGVGTGGTLSGTAAYLKQQNPNIRIIAVEPASSPLLSEGHAGPHKLQGIGANFVPATLNRTLIDEILPVSDAAAYRVTRMIARREGLLVGISSGAAASAALAVAARPEYAGRNIVAIFPDTGERYLSTGVFD